MIMWILSFILTDTVYYSKWFSNQHSMSGVTALVMTYSPLYKLLDLVYSILLRILMSIFISDTDFSFLFPVMSLVFFIRVILALSPKSLLFPKVLLGLNFSSLFQIRSFPLGRIFELSVLTACLSATALEPGLGTVAFLLEWFPYFVSGALEGCHCLWFFSLPQKA